MPSLRRFGQAAGAGLESLGSTLEENEKLKQEYGYRNALRADQQAQHEQDFQQRQQDIETSNAAREQGRKDTLAGREQDLYAAHPEIPERLAAGGGTAGPQGTPFTSYLRSAPEVQGAGAAAINKVTDPNEIMPTLQSTLAAVPARFQGPQGAMTQGALPTTGGFTPQGDVSGDTTSVDPISTALKQIASQRQQALLTSNVNREQAAGTIDPTTGQKIRTVQGPSGPVNIPTERKPADVLADEEAKDQARITAESAARQNEDRLKEQLRQKTALSGSNKALPMANQQIGDLIDLWDKANAGESTLAPKLGVGGYVSAFGRHMIGQAPSWAQGIRNPNITAYEQAVNRAAAPIAQAAAGGTGSRGAALAHLFIQSFPKYGDDPTQGHTSLQKLQHQLQYLPAATQFSEDHPAEDVYTNIQAWDKAEEAIAADIKANGAKSPYLVNGKPPKTIKVADGVYVPYVYGGG